MVKVKGPALSAGARGSLANLLTFGLTGKTAHVRKKPVGKQPRSGLQVSMRAMMSFLTSQWRILTSDQQNSWPITTGAVAQARYNNYLAYNLGRWRSFATPAAEWPPTYDGTSASGNHMETTGGTRHVRIHYWYTGVLRQQWSILLCRGTTPGFTPAVDNAIAWFPSIGTPDTIYDDSPLTPGTYYYRGHRCLTTGKMYAPFPELSATVT